MKLPDDFYFTQSNLQDYVDCAYRFYLRHIIKIKWPALEVGDAVEFELRGQTGARFHRLIQQYLLGVTEDRLRDLAIADPNPEVAEWWESFLLYVPAWLDGKRFVETALTASLTSQRLVAKYDLILAKDTGNLSIFDWKTSKKHIRKDWLQERVQTRLYLFILLQAGSSLVGDEPIEPGQIDMNYWFVSHPEIPIAIPYSQSTYENDRSYFTKMIKDILDRDSDDFLRTTDHQKCRFCVYRSHCDRGTEAGDLTSFTDFEIEADNGELAIDYESIDMVKF